MTEDFQLIRRDKTIPTEADFAIILDSPCMEPLIPMGQRVYVNCRAELRELDVGLFYYEGRVYCRQWCEDYNGALLLLCPDSRHEKDCLYLDREARKRCLCLGKVLI